MGGLEGFFAILKEHWTEETPLEPSQEIIADDPDGDKPEETPSPRSQGSTATGSPLQKESGVSPTTPSPNTTEITLKGPKELTSLAELDPETQLEHAKARAEALRLLVRNKQVLA